MTTQLRFNTNLGEPIYLNDNDKPSFYINFDDVAFAEKAMRILPDMMEKAKQFDADAIKLQKIVEKDPSKENIEKVVTLRKERFQYMKDQIDALITKENADLVFNGQENEELAMQFMEFIGASVKKLRGDRTKNYNKASNKVSL